MSSSKPTSKRGRKVPQQFERFAKFAKTVFGVPKTEVEVEHEKWQRERAERRAAKKA
jgi:hypothetical protein